MGDTDITRASSSMAATLITCNRSLPPPCNHPHDAVSPQVASLMELVLYGGLLPLLVTLGVIGNVISMAVCARQGLSDRVNLCLFSLAVSDSVMLVFVAVSKSGFVLLGLVDRELGEYWQSRHFSTVLGVYLGAVIVSNVITAILAVERCVCVVAPLKTSRLVSKKFLIVVMVTVAAYAVGVKSAALALKYHTQRTCSPTTNATIYISRLTPFYLRHKLAIDILYNYSLSVTVPTICLLLVTLCTALTVFKLRASLAWRQITSSVMTSSEKRETSMTRLLMTVCVVYVACSTPSVVRQFLLAGNTDFLVSGRLCNVYRVVAVLTHVLECLNAAVNFAIYYKQSCRFRASLRQLCRRKGVFSGGFPDTSKIGTSNPNFVHVSVSEKSSSGEDRGEGTERNGSVRLSLGGESTSTAL